MPSAFDFSVSPFDCLSAQEQKLVKDSVDIAYFKEGDVIYQIGSNATHLYVIIKGYVRQVNGDEDVAMYGPEDTFDARGLMTGRVSDQFIAAEEVIAYQLAKSAISELIASNAHFGAMLFSDLSNKLTALAERHSQHEIHSLSMAKVSEAFLRAPHFVDSDVDILSVVKIFQEKRVNNILVRNLDSTQTRIGIFTATSLVRASSTGKPLGDLKVGDYTNYNLVTVDAKSHLYDALAVMVRHKVNRVVVMDSDSVVGILEQIDLLSYVANSSSLIVQKILAADSLATLKDVSFEIVRLISILHSNGSKVSMIAKLVQELNAKLFEKTWQLIAPPDLIEHSCLVVMGSEGRGEQLLKTDQDNALIVADSFANFEVVRVATSAFSDALIDFGYPECPGKIMVNNSDWCKSESEFKSQVKSWVLEPTPDHLMYLAIFLDAHAVAGNPSLLKNVKEAVFQYSSDNQFHLMRFAAAVELISTEIGWWDKLLGMREAGSGMVNLKKAGIFAIVHGIRSLALENRVTALSTADRIAKLAELHKLDNSLAAEILESLYFLMALKLRAGLHELATGKEVSGDIDTSRLSSLDRDLLKEALGVVKRFKSFLRQHFRLDLA
jgi:CBS domain-containing protein